MIDDDGDGTGVVCGFVGLIRLEEALRKIGGRRGGVE